MPRRPHASPKPDRARPPGEREAKTCARCGRPFTWRRKWARDWAEVRYCSDRCRAGGAPESGANTGGRAAFGAVLALLVGRAGPLAAQPAPAAVRPAALAAWVARAESLEGDRAALGERWERQVLAMRRHAVALDPDVVGICGFDNADFEGRVGSLSGFTSVHRLTPDERLVLVHCTTGAVLGNTVAVPYRVRLGAAPGVGRLAVPGWREDGRVADDTTVNGMIDVDVRRRRVRVENRCCAGSQGTTREYLVSAPGGLRLLSVTAWEYPEGGQRRRVVSRFVAATQAGVGAGMRVPHASAGGHEGGP